MTVPIYAGYNLDNLRSEGTYTVSAPLNGPTTGSYYLEVVNLNVGGVSTTIQRAWEITTAAASVRVHGASGTWSSWAPMGQASSYPASLASVDAADTVSGRQRVSEPHTVFESQSHYSTQSGELWEYDTTGSGAVSVDTAFPAIKLAVTTASGDEAIKQSKKFFDSHNGREIVFSLDFIMDTPAANLTQSVGIFTDNDGIFLRQTGASTVELVYRTKVTGSVVNTTVDQADWNRDPLDGGGRSAVTLDLTKKNTLVIDLDFATTDRVRVGFLIQGEVIYVHEFDFNNAISTTAFSEAHLPIRYQITADDTLAGAATLRSVGALVVSESGPIDGTESAYLFSTNNGISAPSVTTRVPILSIRPKTTFNSEVVRDRIEPTSVMVGIRSGDGVLVEIVYNGTLTSASFASVDSNSFVEKDVAATAISGGIVLHSFYVLGSNQARSTASAETDTVIPFTLNFDGSVADILTVVCTSVNATTLPLAAISWKEFR